jgi:hypothetical protein
MSTRSSDRAERFAVCNGCAWSFWASHSTLGEPTCPVVISVSLIWLKKFLTDSGCLSELYGVEPCDVTFLGTRANGR